MYSLPTDSFTQAQDLHSCWQVSFTQTQEIHCCVPNYFTQVQERNIAVVYLQVYSADLPICVQEICVYRLATKVQKNTLPADQTPSLPKKCTAYQRLLRASE
jgi:hypothetical protein